MNKPDENIPITGKTAEDVLSKIELFSRKSELNEANKAIHAVSKSIQICEG